MRCWNRLVDWTEEEQTSAQMYQRVSQASAYFEEGSGGLWRDPELEIGLKWRVQTRPAAAWAFRYDTNFDRAMKFLDRSAQERNRLVAEREQERRRKLHQAWFVASVLGFLLIACSILLGLPGPSRTALRSICILLTGR